MANIKLTESEIKALDLIIELMQEEESGTTPKTVATVPAAFPAAVVAVTARAVPVVVRATPNVARAARVATAVTDFVGGFSAAAELSSQQKEAVRELDAQLDQEVTLEKLLEIRRNLQMDE